MADSREAQPLLPLQYKTWVLKVSIHCEGCKKKVKKLLTSMEDVYKVEVDAQQNKVTVTGNVDADVLIKRLLKSGKHAQLCQEKNDAKKDNINKHEKQPKTAKPSAKKAADAKPKLDGESTAESTGELAQVAPAAAGESYGKDAGDGEGGESSKKKKKKGQKGQSSESGKASEGGKVDGGAGGGCYYPVHPPAGHQPPIYAVNYHTAHPTWSYAVNYGPPPPPPPPPPHAYACAAPPPASSSSWETYCMSSDENPNSCVLM